MTAVEAHTTAAAESLADMLRLISHDGAYLRRGLVVSEEHGTLRLESREPDEGSTLISIPARLLPAVNDGPEGIVEPSTLGQLMLSVYEATGKFATYLRGHPRGVLTKVDALTSVIQQVRPHWTPDPSMGGFLRTRTIQAPGTGVRHLMPILDAMNHDSRSPGYSWMDGRLSVVASRPTGTAECFVGYHQHPDPVDLALNYGFVDPHATWVHLAPAEIEIPRVGSLAIGSARPRTHGSAVLPRASITRGRIELTHLMIDAARPAPAREAVRLPVAAVARRVGMTPQAAEREADRAWMAVLEAHAGLLQSLHARAQQYPGVVGDVIGEAAAIQRAQVDGLS